MLKNPNGLQFPTFFQGIFSDPVRSVFWTVGNHVDAKLDNATLVSSTLSLLDIENRTILVPWGGQT